MTALGIRFVLIGSVIAAPLSCTGVRSGDPDTLTTVFIGVHVVPMTNPQRVLQNQTVIVRGDRIASIVDRDEARVSSEAQRVDAAGKYLMPGLADMHVHLEYFDDPALLQLFLAFGVTTVRNMDGRPTVLDWRRQIQDGTVLGPTIYTAGPLLDGDPPLLPDNMVIRNAEEARAAVVGQDSAGYDFVKVYTNLPRDAYEAVLSTAAERDLDVAGHVPRGIDLVEALDSGQRTIEHLGDYADFIEGEDSPFRDSWHWSKRFLGMPIDQTQVRTIAARQRDAGVWAVPTIVQADRELAKHEMAIAWLERPEMAYLPADAQAFWAEHSGRVTDQMDNGDWELVDAGRLNRRTVVRVFHSSGVSILAGTDTPNPFVIPGLSLHAELVNLTEAGLSAEAALAAATRQAAQFVRAAGEWGTIAVNRRADLLLLDENPMDSIVHTNQIAGVMVRGRWMPREQLDAMLARLERHAHQPNGNR